MNKYGRPPGVIETRRRATKPPAPWHTTVELLHSQIDERWLIWQGSVYCIGTMYAGDYEKWVRSHAKSPFLLDILTKGIDNWDDSYSRWYTALELLKRGKITLYSSQQAAERALEVGA